MTREQAISQANYIISKGAEWVYLMCNDEKHYAIAITTFERDRLEQYGFCYIAVHVAC